MTTIAAAPSDAECDGREVFTYFGTEVDVTAILEDIASGRLKPQRAEFDRKFIEAFATEVQGLRKNAPESTNVSMLTGVRAVDVHNVPDTAYEKPVVLAYMGRRKGMLNLGEGAHYVLVDGNKRMGKAFFTGRTNVDVVILSAAQSRKYKR